MLDNSLRITVLENAEYTERTKVEKAGQLRSKQATL